MICELMNCELVKLVSANPHFYHTIMACSVYHTLLAYNLKYMQFHADKTYGEYILHFRL